MDFTLENPLTDSDPVLVDIVGTADGDKASLLFMVERDHMPSSNYVKLLQLNGLEASVRRETVSSILQLSRGFDPLLSYLAVNYLDRFLSGHQLHVPKLWILRLLAVSCVALASKMMKMETPFATLQGNHGDLILEASMIQRMEMVILGALKWRMRSVTPFSFVPFFISEFNLEDSSSTQNLRDRVIEIVHRAQHDFRLLEFKPSVTVASALLVATQELFPSRFPGFETDILSCSFVNKEELMTCLDAMQDVAKEGYESGLDVESSAATPTNVLDHYFSCSDSETANVETESVPCEEQEKAPTKRRKTH